MARRYQDLLDHDVLKQVPSGEVILVALSGGPDSVAMLLALREVAEHRGWTLQAIYVDHKTRAAAAEEVLFVQQLCSRIAVPITVEIISSKRAAGHSAEMHFRNERYAAIARVAEAAGARYVCLGHTSDDMVESFLYRLSRWGSGGEVGFPPLLERNGLIFVRPFWNTWKRDILAVLKGFGQSFAVDLSNEDVELAVRNRIRHHILPFLRDQLNPNIDEALQRAALAFDVTRQSSREQWYSIVASEVLRLEDSMQMLTYENDWLFNRWFRSRTGRSLPPRLQLQVLSKVRSRTPARFQIAGNQVLVLDGKHAWVSAGSTPEALTKQYLSYFPSEYICGAVLPKVVSPGATIMLLDGRQLVWPDSWPGKKYIVRNRWPGDRLLSGKLKDYLISERVPDFVREFMLILEEMESGRIVCVLGLNSLNRRLGWQLPQPVISRSA